jgi:hypothetical protein
MSEKPIIEENPHPNDEDKSYFLALGGQFFMEELFDEDPGLFKELGRNRFECLSEKRINLHASIGNNPAYCYFENDVAKAVEGLKQESERKSIKYAVLCEGYEGNHTKAVKKHLLKLIEEHQWFRRKIDEVFGK